VISAQKKDPDIKVVANTMNNPFYLVVKPDSGISRLSDLKHKTIASTSAGGGFDQWIKTALTLNTDLNLNTDVKFLYVGAAQAVISAVQGGTADAGTANFTTLAQAKKEKLTTVHVPSSPKNPAPSVWGISEKHAASKRKAIETFFADMAKGARYAKNPNNKADTIKIIAKYYKIGHQEAVAMYKNQVPALTSDLSVNANDIKPALKYGVIKSLRNDNPKNYIDTSWVK
jgi:ABC-type nitrate/sulfonate/bicarbonate transport system substrate-binding protein